MTPAELVAALNLPGPDGVWRIPPDAKALTSDMFTATTTPPSLAEMQAYVGGYVELVRVEGVGLGWLNEEGKIEGLALNSIGTLIAWATAAIYPSDCIVGPLMITKGKAEPD